MEIWIWILIAVLLIALIVISGLVTQCPNPDCKKWWARKFIDKKEIDREKVYKDVDRVDEIYDESGNLIGTKKRKERVPVIVITYRNYYKCRYCGHKWSDTSKIEKNI